MEETTPSEEDLPPKGRGRGRGRGRGQGRGSNHGRAASSRHAPKPTSHGASVHHAPQPEQGMQKAKQPD